MDIRSCSLEGTHFDQLQIMANFAANSNKHHNHRNFGLKIKIESEAMISASISDL
jgi:hypothetical protein